MRKILTTLSTAACLVGLGLALASVPEHPVAASVLVGVGFLSLCDAMAIAIDPTRGCS